MLSFTSDPIRTALNRVTFGARESDVASAHMTGWVGWVQSQLVTDQGDDGALAAHLARQTMRIAYAAPVVGDMRGTWTATDEDRPLRTLNESIAVLWNIARNIGTTFAVAERTRLRQELAAATWIRNTHSSFQLREFMVDFWHNHFNIGKNENEYATGLLAIYDRDVIRVNALGNFRAMLEASARSTSMLMYLDNYISNATTPNENYAREIMELHTLGGGAYLGTVNPVTVPRTAAGVALGFTDQDIVQASRILSGWTVQYGQRGAGTANIPNTGEFIFNSRQHNGNVGTVLGVSMAGVANDMAQGQRFFDILAAHPSTATFIVGKLARRIFGESPPAAVIARGVTAWSANVTATDQIARTLRAMLLDGDEIMTAPVNKVRRPYERIIAMARTTGMTVSAGTFMHNLLDPVTDGLFAWGAPNGRPDFNAYWLATGSTVATWNYLFTLPANAALSGPTMLTDQAPPEAMNSAITIVEYWVGRMVGNYLSGSAMGALTTDQAGASGVPAAVRARSASRIETANRRLVSLIATSEEFSLR